MTGVFRFPNPGSDIGNLIQTYREIYNHFHLIKKDGNFFDHKEASAFLAEKGLASSLGAVGPEAVQRSRRPNTSRDPLYNQHKMYSEIYRMLGWYEPGSKKTNFNLTEFGSYIVDKDSSDTLVANLFAINILHIASPNPLTRIRGGNVLRPLPLILKMMGALDGYLTKGEMILSVLACPDDKATGYVEEAANAITQLRSKKIADLNDAICKLMNAVGVKSDETLPNYTRFPIAAVKWTGWAEGTRTKDYYDGKSVNILHLTPKGENELERLKKAVDIRFRDLLAYEYDEQAAFTAWSNIYHLDKAGFNIEGMSEIVTHLESVAARVFTDFKINKDTELLYFGYQEAPRDVLKRGDELMEEV